MGCNFQGVKNVKLSYNIDNMGQRQMARGYPRRRWPKNFHAGFDQIGQSQGKEIKFIVILSC